ncbi:MAG: type III pantothenate kinase [Burkholderiaceae bacterium]|jgi:type III pantothenate kinase|nr:type III pantothenate kinase [Burkholderiaceae bacterium]
MSLVTHWLLLDAGNSALKWVLMTTDGHVGPAHGTRRNAPPEELSSALAQEWAAHGGAPVQAAYGCAVASPATMRAVERAAQQAFSLPVQWLGTQARFEHGEVVLRNGYRDCTQLGADRWHSLLAARAAHPGRSLVVVTAGTATTVDGVTIDGSFVGGVIAPGVRLMYEALTKGTARLPVSRGNLVAYPDNTDDAIASGVLGSQLGLIERFVRSFRVEHGAPLVILSGGHAAQLAPHVGVGTSLPSVVREENLVLRGVYLRACELAAPATGAGGAAR